MLQKGYPHVVSVDQSTFHKLLTNKFMLELGISPYTTLHNFMNTMENQNNTFVFKPTEDKDDNELIITFQKEYISSESLGVITVPEIKIPK